MYFFDCRTSAKGTTSLIRFHEVYDKFNCMFRTYKMLLYTNEINVFRKPTLT
jgi:hypothetical protein